MQCLCGLIGKETTSSRYTSCRPEDGRTLIRLRKLSQQAPTVGPSTASHTAQVGGRKRSLGTRTPQAIKQDQNRSLTSPSIGKVLTGGRRFRRMVAVGDLSQEQQVLVVDLSVVGFRVSSEL
jgi:hypothetical protein